GQQIGAAVLRSLARDPAVHRARLNYPLSRVIVEIDPEADPAADTLPRLCDLVARAETGVAAQPEAAQPGDLPGDGILLALKAITVAASGIGIGVAAVGRTLMLPRLPAGVMAAVSAVDYQPKVRAVLEGRLGVPGADAVLSLGAATVYALTQAPAAVTVEFVRHLAQLAETAAAADAWQALEPELAPDAECRTVGPE
ncbi:hypothetical protein J6K59_10405, partial [Leuconostoc mesenteroides]|nr:hypothetical protein [Leuconostoc mesenteroides]